MNPSDAGGSSDPVMLELFGAEVDMHLPVLSENLLAMEKGRAGKSEIDSMMRAAHSIKGAARIVGNDRAVRVSHLMEDCFTAAKEDRLTLGSDVVDVLLEGVDVLQRICSPEPDAELSDEFITSILDRITAARDGKAAATPAPAVVAPSSPSPPAPPPTAAESKPADSVALAAAQPTSTNTVVLPARFDDAAAESLRGDLCDNLARGLTRIRIDFGQVEQLSAAALALLLSFTREAEGAQPAIVIEAHRARPPVLALLRVVGLKSAFHMSD